MFIHMRRFVVSLLIYAAFSSTPYAILERQLVLRVILAVCDLLIVRISEIPSLGCPRDRLVASSASVRCSENGRRAMKERGQPE